jgi:hypothetical protein
MSLSDNLKCDGCGQVASPGHIAARLNRLERATRYRPVHIGTLFLAAVAPKLDSQYLYSGQGEFVGEANLLLATTGIVPDGKDSERVLAEVQRGGYFLTHVLECPLENGGGSGALNGLLRQRLGSVAARIRRSLRPKRIALISKMLDPMIETLQKAELGCPLVLDGGGAFDLGGPSKEAFARLRELLQAAANAAR